jgi:hypothetical protein
MNSTLSLPLSLSSLTQNSSPSFSSHLTSPPAIAPEGQQLHSITSRLLPFSSCPRPELEPGRFFSFLPTLPYTDSYTAIYSARPPSVSLSFSSAALLSPSLHPNHSLASIPSISIETNCPPHRAPRSSQGGLLPRKSGTGPD